MTPGITLVTGGWGFIGHHVVAELLARHHHVRVLDLNDPHPSLAQIDQVETIKGSITDRECVRTALAGVSYVFHLAAKAHLWERHPQIFDHVNHIGTRILLEEALAAGVQRVIHTSTEAVLKSYRWSRPPSIIDESIDLQLEDMAGPYCRSKFLAEQEARAFVQRGLPVVIVNPTLPIGPGDYQQTPPTRMLLGFLNQRYPAYLESYFNIIDVRDLARGHILAAERGQVGERYILGHSHITLTELLKVLEQITQIQMPRFQIPYRLAWTLSLLQEGLMTKITHQSPTAPLTGVRLARISSRLRVTKAIYDLGLTCRELVPSLQDALTWYRACHWVPKDCQLHSLDPQTKS